ncbi:MAG: YihY/virulence factor BrkB family protein [Deltaproteobacteria bacterium]|nr:YihY/virulence factor BrkB family protein [Deltaproteobacteria bacterium]
MTISHQNKNWMPGRFFRFLLRVLHSFKRNQGLLLSGAVAYYTLLSIVPLSILALIVLTHFIEQQQLIHTLSTYLEMVIPGYAATLTEQVRVFLDHRKVVGIIGFLVMLFFSSIAFSMLENAMSVIFIQRVRIKRRNFLVSIIIPYVYIFLMGLGILLVSLIAGVLEILGKIQFIIFGWSLNFDGAAGLTLYMLGFIGEVVMLTSIYLVMPVVRVRFRHALIGGVTATVLWEFIRRAMVWYFAYVSNVNLIYGSIAITVVALLSIKAVTLIILLCAQVIAELERKPNKLDEEKLSGFETP